MQRVNWLVLAGTWLWVGQAAAAHEDSSVGLSLEVPVLTALSFSGKPRAVDNTFTTLDHHDVYAGPFLHNDDYGSQVPVLVALRVPVTGGLLLGGRFGAGSMCLDGPGNGDQGKGMSWSIEPFAQYVFGVSSRLRPFVTAGPFLGHTCAGNTADQWQSSLYGVDIGGGGQFDLARAWSIYGELRGSAGWGETRFYSQGETAMRWDPLDLRAKILLGATYWF